MGKIRIKKKAYTRKSYVKKIRTKSGVKTKRIKATRVRESTFLTKDMGKKGRTPKNKRVIKIKKTRDLGKGFFSKPATARHRKEAKLAERVGNKRVQGKLQALSTLMRNTKKSVSKKAAADRKWLAKYFQKKRNQ